MEELSGVCNPQLTLKASTKLPLVPLKGCVQVLPAEREEEKSKLTVVSLHSPSEGEVHVLVSEVELALGEGEKQPEEGEEILKNHTKTSNNITQLKRGEEKEVSVTKMDTDNHLQESPKLEKGGKGRKRRRHGNDPPTRKSVRLQGRVGRERERGEREREATEARRREEERERWRKRETERVRGEQRAVCGRVVEFVSSLEDKTSFTHHPLPQVCIQ